MYLGDSITEICCWRSVVWDDLAKANLTGSVQMVGSMNNNPQNCKATASGFDTHHEGHSGWQAVNIASQYIDRWSKSTPADIVQIMLGTNDVGAKRTTQQVIDAYTKIVSSMREQLPNAKFILDKVITLPRTQAPVDDINKAIPAWVEANTKPNSPIVIADCSKEAGFTAGMLRDGVHPNAQGDQFMAKQISPLLIQFVKDKLAGK